MVQIELTLEKPSMGNIANALGAKMLSNDKKALGREIYQYKVAAMLAPDFLDYVETGDLIITPGDRSDIILASLMAYHSTNYPQISGLLLTGDQEPEPQIQKLIAGLGDLQFSESIPTPSRRPCESARFRPAYIRPTIEKLLKRLAWWKAIST